MIDNSQTELAILGASGHGKVVADLAEQLGYSVCFYDDASPTKTHIKHWPIYGSLDDLLHLNSAIMNVAVAIGNNAIRQEITLLLQKSGFNLPILLHPSAQISKYAEIDVGTFVFAGAVINAFASVGKGCIVNTGAVIEHDCVVSDFVHISPNTSLAGGVHIGVGSWVGIGSQVKQLVEIGDNCLVGAGSTVLKNIPANVIAFGSPAIIVNSKY